MSEQQSAAARLQEIRVTLGKSPDEVAQAMGINLPSYYDLESYGDELYMCPSLSDLRSLCKFLGITGSVLFTGQERATGISPSELARRMVERREELGLCWPDFEELVGWGIQGLVDDPNVAWEWNVDCLRDLCQVLRCDWIEALTGLFSEPTDRPVTV